MGEMEQEVRHLAGLTLDLEYPKMDVPFSNIPGHAKKSRKPTVGE
jgi:hypothetical protein